LRILFLNPVGSLGGAERSLIEVLSILSEDRPEWVIGLITGRDGPLVNEAKSLGVKVEILSMPTGIEKIGDSGFSGQAGLWRLLLMAILLPYKVCILLIYLRRFAKKIQEINPDVIHSNGFKFHVILGLTRGVRSKTIWHARDFIKSRKLVGQLLRAVCRKPNLLVANSHAVENDWKSLMPDLKSIVLYNTVAIPHKKSREIPCEHFYRPISDIPVKVGLVGSFARWKGHKLFLEAVRILTEEFSENKAQFFIVGGPLYATTGSQWTRIELERMASSLGITDRVVFVPHQTDVNSVYECLDIIVHASTKPEPFGRTIIEGMSYRKPVVAAMAGGVVEIIEDGKDALAFQPGDSKDLADKIGEVLRDQKLRIRIGEEGYQKVSKLFSRESIRLKLVKMYEGLMEEHS
jgi:glycosyltransferase involved in cell wall biosynthesis